MHKPVILIGNGARGNPALVEHLCSLGIPVLTTWMAIDLVAEDCPAFCGRPGIFGQRAANIIQQKATHLMCFGARLDGEQVAYDYDRFAPDASIMVYEIDTNEWSKFPARYRCTDHLGAFAVMPNTGPAWLAWCKSLYARFRPELDGRVSVPYVDPFAFIRVLSDACQPEDMLAIGSSGGAPNTFLQAFRAKAGQRVSNACTIGAMGADIPMAVGAALATGRRTVCVTGDGGFVLNTQELEVARRLRLPLVIFVYSNGGYGSIRASQRARFGRVTGADKASGLTLPLLEDVAHTYGFAHSVLYGTDLERVPALLDAGPRIVEVMVDPEWVQLPRVIASTVDGQLRTDDMENMTPKLPPDELAALMEWGNDA